MYGEGPEMATSASGPWTVAADELATTTRDVTGLRCGTTYRFRVSARGNGDTFSVEWGTPSGPVSHAAGPCNRPPVFSTSTYTLLVAENAPRRSLAGNILATDADGDFVTYHITAGNTGGKFETSSGNDGGEILVWGALDYDTRSSYTLRVEARDGRGGTARATVEISVVRAGQSLPAAPQGVSASLENGVFTISWNAVTGAGLYVVEYRAAGARFWNTLSYTASTTQVFRPGACGTMYEFRVQAQGDGVSRVARWGPPSSAVQAASAACRPTLSAASDSVFVGEDVALRARSGGTVSHYQWQHWANGAWTNLGATTTSATRNVTSSAAGVKFYRVVATYGSGATGESAPVAVEWKAIHLGVTSSPAYPQSGPAATSTVTLTASGDVPLGISYQWQEDTGSGGWTHLATTTSPTTEVSSTARGTRKFRVAVTHAGVTAHSEPVYVTWDEWAIVADMVRELSSAVASSTAYTTAQTALLTCMNGTGAVGDSGPSGQAETTPPAVTFASFDDLLANYTGDVKARMETGGDCAATSTAMFNTNQRRPAPRSPR